MSEEEQLARKKKLRAGHRASTPRILGQIRHGKRIAVQATTAGRRRKVQSKGRQVPGWPIKGCRTSQKAAEVLAQSRHYLPILNKPKGRRIHSLRTNITTGQQNAGKWWLINTTCFHAHQFLDRARFTEAYLQHLKTTLSMNYSNFCFFV